MDLTELPSALFCMKNVESLRLEDNKLCSLPSEIAHMTTLEELWVRRSSELILISRLFRSTTTGSHLSRPSSGR
jgi:Leucine-rich repeat (LRR) protein